MSDPFAALREPTLWGYLRGPWSWRRLWHGPCALLAAVPGVREYVLETTPIKDHPMYPIVERAWCRAAKDER